MVGTTELPVRFFSSRRPGGTIDAGCSIVDRRKRTT